MSAIRLSRAARIGLHTLVAACASLALVSGAQAQHGGGRGGGFGGGGVHVGPGGHVGGPGHGFRGGPRYGYRGGSRYGWGGVGLGLGFGLGWGAAYGWPYYAAYPYAPGYVLATPATDGSVVGTGQPMIYPRNGQTPAQTTADSNVCSQWAGQQPNATTDAVTFRRNFAVCMDGRGYSIQ